MRRVLRDARRRNPGQVLNDAVARSQDPGLAGVVADMRRAGVTPGDLLGPGMSAISPAYMAFWDPVLSALYAARAGGGDDERAAAELFQSALAEAEQHAVADQLATALRRVAAGERSPHDLVAGLDPLDTAIVLRAIGVLAGTVTLPALLWQSVPVRGALMSVITATAGFRGPADPALGQYLAMLDSSAETAPLSVALRAILAGERNRDVLVRGLGPAQDAMVTTILTHLAASATAS